MKAVYLIPAYQPSEVLEQVVQGLRDETPDPIGVIDDGSEDSKRFFFERLTRFSQVTVLRHAVNLGKGAALKTGLHWALVNFPGVGIVTLDADGQHLPQDVLKLSKQGGLFPQSLLLGCRQFSRKSLIPLRSRLGNQLTKKVFQFLTGVSLDDTQTGLRGIPPAFARELLRLKSTGYDFETDMLILALRKGFSIQQVPISTVYLDGNKSSHFNPILDSIRIYFVFIRFFLNSMVTAIVDFLVFAILYQASSDVFFSAVMARLVAGGGNFWISKSWVFHSRGKLISEAIRYFVLVTLLLSVSLASIKFLIERFGIPVYLAKFGVETSLFLLSFAGQRLIVFSPILTVFTPQQSPSLKASVLPTDWDTYYRKPFCISSWTRRYTIHKIIKGLKQFLEKTPLLKIIELGGGNSCIYGTLRKEFKPERYHVLDQNELGLIKFQETYSEQLKGVTLQQGDVLQTPPLFQADLCLSLGLIEHFLETGTQQAIQAHFKAVREGGLVLITFPTPTKLYRVIRWGAELFRCWHFPDERPCSLQEVRSEVERWGEVLHCSILWPILLTQGLIIARRFSEKKTL